MFNNFSKKNNVVSPNEIPLKEQKFRPQNKEFLRAVKPFNIFQFVFDQFFQGEEFSFQGRFVNVEVFEDVTYLNIEIQSEFIQKDDLKISVEENEIVIIGKSIYDKVERDESVKYRIRESNNQFFEMRLEPPFPVDVFETKAFYENSIIQIKIPKILASDSSTIRVNLG